MYFVKSFMLAATMALLAAMAATELKADNTAPAQAQTSTVSGTLVDAQGKAIARAVKVLLAPLHRHDVKAKVVHLTPDDKGAYSFTEVTPGNYTISAISNLSGSTLMTRELVPIVVEAGKDLVVDPITLYPR